MMTSNRTFGIEIEAFGITMQAARLALRNAGLDCEIEGYNHETRAHWKVVSDASVPDGFEVVSPVLEGERGLAQAKNALDALHAAGSRLDRRCGLHAHYGIIDLTAAEIATVVRRYAKFEDEIDAWMAPSRRGDANRYCRSVKSFLSRGEVTRKLASGSVRDVCDAFGTRYAKVNLEAWRRHRTIEFRQHGGTVESEKALAWIRFGLGFIEESRRVAHGTNTAALIPTNSKMATVMTMLSRMGGASIDDLIAATGWKRHSLRAAISTQLRKRGLEVVSRRENGTTIYAIINRAVDAADDVMAGIDDETAEFLRRRAAHFARRERRAA
ncbi:MAG: amidoligase family protein [Defluviicoccus sp.]|nr:amidoligase family protein [Defluviicoccus sp.]